jgi:bifunctional DNA primase/polymerase-like protein/AAA domain-containing protein
MAAWAASRGWTVVKLVPGTKKGAEEWRDLGYRDPRAVRAAWGKTQWGVGILTGPSKLVDDDLDVDEEGNPAGEWSLADLAAAARRELPRTFTLATPSGGTHLVWSSPNGREFKTCAGQVGDHIDVRGRGGLFVLWDPKRPRIITDDRDPVPIPRWLADLHPEPGSEVGTLLSVPNSSAWIKQHGGGEPCARMSETSSKSLADLTTGNVHDAMANGVYAVIGDCVAGHKGAGRVLGEFQSMFYRAMRGKSRESDRVADWHNAVNGAIAKKLGARGGHVTKGDPCSVDDDVRGIGEAVKKTLGSRLLVAEYGGDWLNDQEFDPLVWAIKDVVPEGLTVMAGPPKVGKSVMLLRFGIEVARGGYVFGIKSNRMPVFYLALEDSQRRLQSRARELLGDDRIPNIRFQNSIHPNKLIETVEAWLDRNEYGMVLVDTLGRALESPRRGETTYDRDYRIVVRLKAIADTHNNSPVVVSHHSKKGKVDDWLEVVSGTNAITGAADTILVLARERGNGDGFLRIAGRDVEEAEYSVILERPYGWRLDGEDLLEAAGNAAARQPTKTRERKDSLGERSQDIIDFLEHSNKPQHIRDVALACGMTPQDATTYLNRLWKAGHIEKPKRGYYGPAGKATVSAPSGEED